MLTRVVGSMGISVLVLGRVYTRGKPSTECSEPVQLNKTSWSVDDRHCCLVRNAFSVPIDAVVLHSIGVWKTDSQGRTLKSKAEHCITHIVDTRECPNPRRSLFQGLGRYPECQSFPEKK